MKELLKAIEDLGFKFNNDYEIPVFTKDTGNGEIQRVSIDFEQLDDDDYVLHSEIDEDTLDWFGHKISTPYGLEGKELKAFMAFAEEANKARTFNT